MQLALRALRPENARGTRGPARRATRGGVLRRARTIALNTSRDAAFGTDAPVAPCQRVDHIAHSVSRRSRPVKPRITCHLNGLISAQITFDLLNY